MPRDCTGLPFLCIICKKRYVKKKVSNDVQSLVGDPRYPVSITYILFYSQSFNQQQTNQPKTNNKMETLPNIMEQQSMRKKRKRSETDMRNQHLEKGALLLRFIGHPQASPEAVHNWKLIESKGFRVNSIGCVFPHEYYQKNGKLGPSRTPGPKTSVKFFLNQQPDAGNDTLKNELGWPIRKEISHLCHDSRCISPNHLVVEERWKNWKRMYCGRSGQCDCGMDPPCLAIHRPTTTMSPIVSITDHEEIKKLMLPYKVIILSEDYFANEDQKQYNRLKRKRKTRRHKRQATKNINKRQATSTT